MPAAMATAWVIGFIVASSLPSIWVKCGIDRKPGCSFGGFAHSFRQKHVVEWKKQSLGGGTDEKAPDHAETAGRAVAGAAGRRRCAGPACGLAETGVACRPGDRRAGSEPSACLPVWAVPTLRRLCGRPAPVHVLPALFALEDRKSTRLNSSHVSISYAVFCLKKRIHLLG